MENQNNTHTNIQDLFNTYLEEGGKPAVTHFRLWLNEHIDEVIKPLCKSSSRSGGGLDGWKSELKDRFGGRGAKWVKIALQDIMPTLERIESEEGVDASHYRALINHAGFAWIRFDAPRVHNGKNCAAFKVLTEGSTFMQPGRLHYIDVSRLDEEITELGGTPKALGLENVVVKTVSQPEVNEEVIEDSHDEVAIEEINEDDF